MPQKLFADLNEEQAQAVKATEGYVRVLAGAGTGKTRALTYRYAYLISVLGMSPRSVLCVTFTNKAATELKQRVFRLCGDIANPFVTTFHGFCAEFLRTEIQAVGFPQNFSILDVSDSKSLIKQIFRALKVNGREFSLKQAWEYIDGRKGDISYVPDLIADDSSILLHKAQIAATLQDKVFYHYLYLERQQYGVDFDDLIALTLQILLNFPEVRARWQQRLEYILVDEFQDIDKLQYQLVEILSEQNRNLFIVGDPDQTIYSFRGADVSLFVNFPQVHSDAKLYSLVHNYRSQPFILDCAYTVISHNQENGRSRLISHLKMISDEAVPLKLSALKEREHLYDGLRNFARNSALVNEPPRFNLLSQEPQSLKPALVHLKTRKQEALFICDEIKELRKRHPKASVAVLYRSRFVSAPLEKAFINAGIPYVVHSDVPFFMRAEIKDAIAYLKLVLNPADDLAFVRVINTPRRGFGKARLQHLRELAEHDGTPLFATLCAHAADSSLVSGSALRQFLLDLTELNQAPRIGPLAEYERIINAFGYEAYLKQTGDEERLASLNMLREQCAAFEREAGEHTVLGDFLHHISLYTEAQLSDKPDCVQLMTVHNAKGLEFDYVFIAALNEKIFPSAKSQNLPQIEEERRLLYVALTRARRQVFMSESADFVVQDNECLKGSRFLNELRPDEIVECGGNRSEIRAGGGVELPQQHFEVGQEVISEVIGRGRVESVDPAAGEYRVFFYELNKIRTMSFRAPLQAVLPASAGASVETTDQA